MSGRGETYLNTEPFKKELLSLKTEIAGRVSRTHKHLHEREERVSAKFAEQSVEMENQELVIMLDSDGRHELALIEAALARIEAGDYGTCTDCGAKIGSKRLKAISYTPHCIKCAS